jgi:DNA polymerase III subunit epsilon
MEFVAIDVETSNADMASICQIGLAKFKDGQLVGEWSTLINPEDYFHFINIDIHGITKKDVGGAPKFPEVAGVLSKYLSGSVCVSHTHFDRVSVWRALKKYSLNPIDTIWLGMIPMANIVE